MLGQRAGSNPTPSYTVFEAASVEIGQPVAHDGRALVEVIDEDAKRAPHPKPKRIDDTRSFIEHFGLD